MDGDALSGRAEHPTAEKTHCFHCFDVIVAHFARVSSPPAPFPTDAVCPLFVTWKSRRTGDCFDELRGCIGCLKPPISGSLGSSLSAYALMAALRDQRFAPMEEFELRTLSCTVALLTHFEQAPHPFDFEIGTHGVLIDYVDPAGVTRTAVYLPEVSAEQGWSKEQTIDSLIRKSGY